MAKDIKQKYSEYINKNIIENQKEDIILYNEEYECLILVNEKIIIQNVFGCMEDINIKYSFEEYFEKLKEDEVMEVSEVNNEFTTLHNTNRAR